ncbi:VOC family protein [Rapidithrix thailandica]|uniref:VOC family protein n=1 Tax=Rapidithrix thailandica TaxID=413964 RepID=A0AAW9SAY3_9BACT
MKIKLTSIPVSDQEKALHFYTEVLNFEKKHDIPVGEDRWLTVVSPEEPDGVELFLEPNGDYPAMKALKEALVKDKIPYTSFEVDDIQKEYKRLKEQGVHFVQELETTGSITQAMLDDTCGNYILIYQPS